MKSLEEIVQSLRSNEHAKCAIDDKLVMLSFLKIDLGINYAVLPLPTVIHRNYVLGDRFRITLAIAIFETSDGLAVADCYKVSDTGTYYFSPDVLRLATEYDMNHIERSMKEMQEQLRIAQTIIA